MRCLQDPGQRQQTWRPTVPTAGAPGLQTLGLSALILHLPSMASATPSLAGSTEPLRSPRSWVSFGFKDRVAEFYFSCDMAGNGHAHRGGNPTSLGSNSNSCAVVMWSWRCFCLSFLASKVGMIIIAHGVPGRVKGIMHMRGLG